MNYKKSLYKVNSLLKFGVSLGLHRVRFVLKQLNNPQDSFKSIHVAGTNGKGSICEMLSSMLTDSKNSFKVGLFTSPHLIDERERIKINNKKISKKCFVRYTEEIFEVIENYKVFLTEFEFITVMAFKFFSDQKIDVAVIETGLGGRLDSTNVIKNLILCIISEISYDHTQILGETIEKIAIEKFGIIKKKIPAVISYSENETILKIFRNKCKKLGCKFICCGKYDVKIKEKTCILKEKYEKFIFKGLEYKIPLFGIHQSLNLSAVLNSIRFIKKYFKIDKDLIFKNFRKISLKSRFEIIRKKPIIILDGAHNQSAVKQLKFNIERYFGNFKKIAIFAAMKDKDIENMLFEIENLFETIIITKLKNNRSESPRKISNFLKNKNIKVIITYNLKDALKNINKNCNYVNVIFGSLYFRSELFKNCKDRF